MVADPIHYSPSLEELEREREERDHSHIHVAAIRSTVDSLLDRSYENEANLEKVIELLERQNALLESIDHAHYNLPTKSLPGVGIIIFLLLAITAFLAKFMFF